jgi:hypothetical protein
VSGRYPGRRQQYLVRRARAMKREMAANLELIKAAGIKP